MPKTRYFVTTYDNDLGRFTPQAGVRKGPYSKWGLRRALRKLRDLGYDARRGDPSVQVEASDWEEKLRESQVALAKRRIAEVQLELIP